VRGGEESLAGKKKKMMMNGNMFSAEVTGVIALVLGVTSLFGFKTGLAFAAIAVGGWSVFKAVRDEDYQYMFLGMVGILTALIAIWKWAVLV
jgi:hypothetical protein